VRADVVSEPRRASAVDGLADSDLIDLHERMTSDRLAVGEVGIDEAYRLLAALLLDLRAVR
jgi:hypothetical protein